MTEFYNAGNYWPDSNNCEIDTFDGSMQGLKVITIKPEDVDFDEDDDDDDDDDESPSSSTRTQTFEEEAAALFEGYGDDQEDHGHIEYIFEDLRHLDQEDNSTSSFSAGSSRGSFLMPVVVEEEEDHDHSHPYPTSRLFTDELELLLTNVDGDDSDPDVTSVIPGPSSSRASRRMYRKSMSLPMSPIGGHRERLDSISFSDFLLSPIKLGGVGLDMSGHDDDIVAEDVDFGVDDFNLINFVGQESPIKVEKAMEKQQPQQKQVQSREEPATSKGKCLQLLRETHERQENMVKRVGAIDPHKLNLVAKKNLFSTTPVNSAKATAITAVKSDSLAKVVKKSVPKWSVPSRKHIVIKKEEDEDTSLKSDPNWSPECEAKSDNSSTANKKNCNSKSVVVAKWKEPKTGSNQQQQQQPAGIVTPKASVVSGNSSNNNNNLNEIKRRFLANLPLVHKHCPPKRKAMPQQLMKVIRSEMPPMANFPDHNYCSPVKRCQPLAKTCARPSKTTILIDDTPSLVKKASPKKEHVVVKQEQTPQSQQPQEVKSQNGAITIKEEPQEQLPVVEIKRRAINLEDYKRLRSGGGDAKCSNGTASNKPQNKSCNISDSNNKSDQSSPLVKPTMIVLPTMGAMVNSATTNIINTAVAAVSAPSDRVVVFEGKYLDPISVAKNKALRMQERRKAARMKQEEITPKTPLVPILPLAVMTGLISEESYLAELNAALKKEAKDDEEEDDTKSVPFDEIMIVSVGCNTKLTIRPDHESTAILSTLSSQMRTKNPLTSNSLLFSIQDVVIKNTTTITTVVTTDEEDNIEMDQQGKSPDSVSPSAPQCSPGKPEGANEGGVMKLAITDHMGYHHGEDKVIMHLRKDRIRPKTSSMCCQTDFTPEFPELKKWVPVVAAFKKRRHNDSRRTRRRRSSSSSSSGGSSDEDEDEDDDYESCYSDRDRERHRSSRSEDSEYSASEDEYGRSAKRRRLYSNRSGSSRSREQSRFRSRSRSPRNKAVAASAWSRASRSRSRSRSMSRSSSRLNVVRNNNNNNSYIRNGGSSSNNNRWNRQKNQSPEERRIVYVGRLENELTKEDLRHKFIKYGNIKLVTLHEKTNGTRYGFVTFEEPADAFKAIETAKEDPILSMYDVGFGGRRAFCGASYADLDNVETEEDMYGVTPSVSAFAQPEESFESLLQSFKRKVSAVGP